MNGTPFSWLSRALIFLFPLLSSTSSHQIPLPRLISQSLACLVQCCTCYSPVCFVHHTVISCLCLFAPRGALCAEPENARLFVVLPCSIGPHCCCPYCFPLQCPGQEAAADSAAALVAELELLELSKRRQTVDDGNVLCGAGGVSWCLARAHLMLGFCKEME